MRDGGTVRTPFPTDGNMRDVEDTVPYERKRNMAKKKTETPEHRAVHIAAVVMQAAGMCRYEDDKCRRTSLPIDVDCVQCIEKWLMCKARLELRRAENE